tara:strand:+ start:2347 stop:2946 length:600 start_codon:yes stop_codon:yes gene_type:complete
MFKPPRLQVDYTTIKTMPVRSPQSLAFEAMWRALPREGNGVPKRSAFLPERAAKLLPHIALVEIHTDAPMTTKVRLIGNTLRMLSGFDVTGLDYLDMAVDRDYYAARTRAYVGHPCGNWSAAPIIYERGYQSVMEMTCLPLTDDTTGGHLILALIYETGDALPEHRMVGLPIELHAAIVNEFIDIGAGVPEFNDVPRKS